MGGIASSYEGDEEDKYPFMMKHALGKIENKIPFDMEKSKLPISSVKWSQEQQITNDSVVNSIISQFAERSRVGYEKYGTTLDRTDLSLLDWVQHAQEEMMDGILYLEKIKKTIIERETMERETIIERETMERE